MNKLLWMKVTALWLAFPLATIHAQFDGYDSPRDSLWIYHMDSIYVTGYYAPQLPQITVTHIPGERIEAMGYRDLNEVITGEVPGFFGNEKGVMGYGVAGGSAGKLSIRGIGGDPTTGILIAQNGKPEMMGLMGHPVPDAYSADVLDEVEIIKGPASILYGTNAMGGVINMKTKRLYQNGWKTRLRLVRGNFGIQRAVLQHGGKYRQFDYFLTYGQRSTNGDRPHSAFNSTAYHIHTGFEPKSNIYLSFTGKSIPFHAEDPGVEGGEVGEEFDIVRSDVTFSARVNFSRLSLNYKIFHNQGEHEITDGFHSTDFCDGLSLKHNLFLIRDNSTIIGIDHKNYGGKVIEINLPPMWENPSGKHFNVSETAFYILTEQQIKKVTPSAGIRFEQHSIFGSMSVPHVGLTINALAHLSLYGSYGKGFRSPTIRELYLFPAPNENLQPEKSTSTQLGLRYHPHPRLDTDLNFYMSDGDNLIEQSGTFPNFELKNSGKFKHDGYELSFKYIPLNGLHLGLNYSAFTSAKSIANQPSEHVRLTVAYHEKLFSIRYNLTYVKGVKYFSMGSYSTLPEYAVSNLGIDIIPVSFGHFFLNMKNIFDKDYQTMHGYPMPGRILEAGFVFDF